MNISETEWEFLVVAKPCGCKEKQKVHGTLHTSTTISLFSADYGQ